MKIAIAGTGYVGLSNAILLAQKNEVVALDIIQDKVDLINSKKSPIVDKEIEEYLASKELNLTATTDNYVAYKDAEYVIISTSTNYDPEKNYFNTRTVEAVIANVLSINPDATMVIKSTVPVGTADRVRETVHEVLAQRDLDAEFDVVSNPEFLKEGAAIDDFMKPDRIVVGTDNPRTTELMRALYAPFNRNHDRLLSMDIRSAELTKYAANATKYNMTDDICTVHGDLA